MSKIWRPCVNVAAVVEQDGKFLLVEEQTSQGLRLNQPSGQWERHETLMEGVIRETLEESAFEFEPLYLLGIYQWRAPWSDVTYLRFAFTGRIAAHLPGRRLDRNILRTVWLSADEIRATQACHRSPLVLRCVQDYLAGMGQPLDMISNVV